MMMFPMSVGVLIASVLLSNVGICVNVMSFFMRIATPEFSPIALLMLLKPLNLIRLLGTLPVSFNSIMSGFKFGNSHCRRYLFA